ncbi:MAG: exosortase A [Pseudomonadota bacterium]|nr:exosortase A [Pseudomonadota bacterium]
MTAFLPEHALNTSQADHYRKRAITAALIYFLVLLGCFYETVWSIVSTWVRSDTYAHGFLILPIAIWMAWGRREEVYQGVTKPEYWAIIPLIGCGIGWLLGELVDVLVVQQFALVGMLVCGLWLILGSAACWLIAFPLAYLVFLVPVGEGLVPPMMEFTATFTVAMIELTGIPVYREGLFFILPTGNWSVVEACSGVRYLIASIALGALYAYINYQSVWRRGIFIIVSIVVPIIANGLRAYIIVMLGHMSDMTIATGVDHLVYGWVFFGLVMFLLFYIGSFWQESEAEDRPEGSEDAALMPNSKVSSSIAAALLAIAVWPGLAVVIEERQSQEMKPIVMPQVNGWSEAESNSRWFPLDGNAQQIQELAYKNQNAPVVVQLIVQSFYRQSRGVELVTAQDLVVPDQDRWRVLDRQLSDSVFDETKSSVREVLLRDLSGEDLLVWHWYRVGKRHTSNDYKAKFYEVGNKLSFGRLDSARLYVAVPISDDVSIDAGRNYLKTFVKAALRDIESSIDKSAGM